MNAFRYPLPAGLGVRLIGSMLARRHIDFSQEAYRIAERLGSSIKVIGIDNVPTCGPCLITINHFSRPGFRSWWLVLSVSAKVPLDIRWIIANAWTYPDPIRSRLLTPLTKVLFTQIAWCFDFFSMPPMPPRPQDLDRRTREIRCILNYARDAIANGYGDRLMIGLAPEGGDTLDGTMGIPPPGVGRFIEKLSRLGLLIVPVGIFEDSNHLCLHFGNAYQLPDLSALPRQSKDREISQHVMEQIAMLMPGKVIPERS